MKIAVITKEQIFEPIRITIDLESLEDAQKFLKNSLRFYNLKDKPSPGFFTEMYHLKDQLIDLIGEAL